MFYLSQIKDYIRVAPNYFGLDQTLAIIKSIKKDYEGYISKELGIVIDVSDVQEIKDGVIIPGDGANYYETIFTLLIYKPELQEVVIGRIKDIAEFGAFMCLGPAEGMIHVSQTMDDFVSFSKDKTLAGKDSKRMLKVGDVCRARMIALSFKDISNPKLGLTMRQSGFGKLDWIAEEINSEKEKGGKKN